MLCENSRETHDIIVNSVHLLKQSCIAGCQTILKHYPTPYHPTHLKIHVGEGQHVEVGDTTPGGVLRCTFVVGHMGLGERGHIWQWLPLLDHPTMQAWEQSG